MFCCKRFDGKPYNNLSNLMQNWKESYNLILRANNKNKFEILNWTARIEIKNLS